MKSLYSLGLKIFYIYTTVIILNWYRWHNRYSRLQTAFPVKMRGQIINMYITRVFTSHLLSRRRTRDEIDNLDRGRLVPTAGPLVPQQVQELPGLHLRPAEGPAGVRQPGDGRDQRGLQQWVPLGRPAGDPDQWEQFPVWRNSGDGQTHSHRRPLCQPWQPESLCHRHPG